MEMRIEIKNEMLKRNEKWIDFEGNNILKPGKTFSLEVFFDLFFGQKLFLTLDANGTFSDDEKFEKNIHYSVDVFKKKKKLP